MKTRATNLSPNAKPWAPHSGVTAHTNSGGHNHHSNNNSNHHHSNNHSHNNSSRSHYTQHRSGGFPHPHSGGSGNANQPRNASTNPPNPPFWSPSQTSTGQKQPQPQSQHARPKFSPTAAKLFVGQLPFECTEERMENLFRAYGTVEHIHILRDNSNRSRGAAFVTYSTVQEADTAIFTLHNRYRMLTNRAIQVSYAKNSPNISRFGACSALEVHESFPTNPVPDVAAAVRAQANDF
ncbi:unnamed protein product [Phytomonas sp. Hart1]|nr:unnamed protein product [Phytomonas sp. Hart1]|eukprot:CCW70127.1 unnamed protein product [Phytomonas sp. isolate Hart1]